MTIRPEQLNALAMTSNRGLLTEHAWANHAAAAGVLGNAALRRTVDAVITRCIQYRLERTSDYLRVMDLVMVFGADWEDKELQWMDEGMRDTRIADPGLRLKKLWRQALRRLAAEAECQ